MFKNLVVISGIVVLLGCSTSPTYSKKDHSSINVADSTLITLSHVKAYLLIGNIKKAQASFDTIGKPQLSMPKTLLTLAELRAASGDAEASQQAFLLALEKEQLDKGSVPMPLVEYFCSQKKWPALEGYAQAFVEDTHTEHQEPSLSDTLLKNSTLTRIGLCFFDELRLEQAHKWLKHIDMTQSLNAKVYLALARIAVERDQYSDAQQLMTLYERAKTNIDAKDLWTAFEVYRALQQPETAEKLGENLRALFPHNQYTRKYILTEKRYERVMRKEQEALTALKESNSLPMQKQTGTKISFHTMKKGETLYQLSKRYSVTIPELQAWNPSLVINDISIGTKIQVSRSH